MVERHRERARALVESVPEEPDVDDAEVAERLREQREGVRERIGSEVVASGVRAPLRTARRRRQAAAALAAAYRAATGDLDRAEVADQRASLRAALLDFERDWTYRGDEAAPTAVVGRALELLVREGRDGVAPERSFPSAPRSEPFAAGDLAAEVAVGRAAVADAERLRARYRESLSDPRPHRTRLSVAASRLRGRREAERRTVEAYLDTDPGSLPFDRDVAGTALAWLHRWAVDGVEIFRSDAVEARYAGHHARELVAAARSLTVLRGLADVVAAIEEEGVAVPESVEDVAAARDRAVDALETAWTAAPRPLAVEVAHWGWRLVDNTNDLLREGGAGADVGVELDADDAHQAWGAYAAAERVAAAVPETVGDAERALDETG
jgi:hypothetical protein